LSLVDDFLARSAARVEQALNDCLGTWEGAPASLVEAVRYSLFAGGKRLRPALALGAAEIVCGRDEAALPAACALEMSHTDSLIHDDLPAMDNDDLRRGRPTLHRAFGEALAILAGDALLTMAFDVLASTGDIRVVREVARASGAAGMVGGQVLDMESEGGRADLDRLRRVHASKTGALIRCAVRSGALLGGARDAALEALTRYGERLGLAFQIADDILDVVGDEGTLGKTVGSDAARGKSTYPSLLGLGEARRLAGEAAQAAVDSLTCFGPEADVFRALALFVVNRTS